MSTKPANPVKVAAWSELADRQPAYGLVAGTRLSYSYGMVKDGVELGRGAEIELILTVAAPTAFRLPRVALAAIEWSTGLFRFRCRT